MCSRATEKNNELQDKTKDIKQMVRLRTYLGPALSALRHVPAKLGSLPEVTSAQRGTHYEPHHSNLIFPSKCPCRPGQGHNLPQEIVLGLHLLKQALKKRDDQRSQLRRSRTRTEGVDGYGGCYPRISTWRPNTLTRIGGGLGRPTPDGLHRDYLLRKTA